MEWFWCRYGFILTLSTMSRCKSDNPTFVDNKRYEQECWFLFRYIVFIIQSTVMHVSSTHFIYLFTLNSGILSFGM